MSGLENGFILQNSHNLPYSSLFHYHPRRGRHKWRAPNFGYTFCQTCSRPHLRGFAAATVLLFLLRHLPVKIQGLAMLAARRQRPAATTFAPRPRPPPHDTALLMLASSLLSPSPDRGGAGVSFARVNKLTFQNTSGGRRGTEDLATSHR